MYSRLICGTEADLEELINVSPQIHLKFVNARELDGFGTDTLIIVGVRINLPRVDLNVTTDCRHC